MIRLVWSSLLAASVAASLIVPGYYAYLIGIVATTALLGVGLNVLLGLAGEVSLGQAGFLALGAYGVAILTTTLGWPFFLALPISVLIVGAIAAVLAVPALRVSGPYLAMVTIAFGFIVESTTIEWSGLTGGASGITGIPAPFGTGGMAALSCVICAAALAGFDVLARSPLGLATRAAATAPAAARGVGIGLAGVRLAAFVLAAVAAGLAGGLQAAMTGFIAPSSFPFSQSILFLLVVMVGGAGSTLGPLLGALVVALLPEVLGGLSEYRLLVFGGGLLVVLWAAPSGLAGLAHPVTRRAAVPRVDTGLRRRSAPRDVAVDQVRVAFGGVVAVNGVSLVARAGEITSVIGPNGAGKTTLLNLISGFQRGDAGRVVIGDRPVSALPAHLAARAGLARTFQTAQPFATLSVLDNVRLGLLRGRWRGTASDDAARALLGFVGFDGLVDRRAGDLAHVDRRLVEIARALATAPAALLLDEPAAGLDAAETARLAPVLRRIADSGIAVVLVEHDMGLVLSISDHVVVLDAGRAIAAGPPAGIRADPKVRAAYLGAAVPVVTSARRIAGPAVLQTGGLDAGYGALPVLSQIGLRVGRGETIAVLGPNGAGKSTLMKALSGLIRPVGGSIRFAGGEIADLPPHRVARAGLVLVPEGRQVFPRLTVLENLRLGATRRGHTSPAEIEDMLSRFPRLRPRLTTAAGLLSGGEQQMLALARGLLAHPAVLMLDEPSLGLAPKIAADLFASLAVLRDEGMTLIVVDQMADHALAIADRGYVLGGGRIVAEGAPETIRGATLDDAYLGTSLAVAE